MLTWISLAHVIKYHWWNRNFIIGPTSISSYPNIYLGIDKAGSWSMIPDRDQWENMLSTGFIKNLNHDTLNISNISHPNVNSGLEYQMKCDDMFSDPESDHIFSYFVVTYLVYILFILVCGNYPLTLKRGRCRNLMSIDSWLNQIEPITNIIFLTNAERGYRKKFEILLGEVF